MKVEFVSIVLVLFVVSCSLGSELDYDEPVINDNLIDFINHDQNLSWKAKKNSKFSKMTVADAMSLLGTHKLLDVPVSDTEDDDSNENYGAHISLKQSPSTVNSIPTHFDSRTYWPGCVHEIRNQGHCGSCWAFAASEVLSDRFCVATNGSVDVVLSPQSLVSCDTYKNRGCNGGFPSATWEYLVAVGIPEELCFPYNSADGIPPFCKKTCANGAPYRTYRARKGTARKYNSVAAMQAEIMAHGPIQGSISVYRDLMSYSSGVYTRKSNQYMGGHAIKIVGWGHDDQYRMDYWIVANSWGQDCFHTSKYCYPSRVRVFNLGETLFLHSQGQNYVFINPSLYGSLPTAPQPFNPFLQLIKFFNTIFSKCSFNFGSFIFQAMSVLKSPYSRSIKTPHHIGIEFLLLYTLIKITLEHYMEEVPFINSPLENNNTTQQKEQTNNFQWDHSLVDPWINEVREDFESEFYINLDSSFYQYIRFNLTTHFQAIIDAAEYNNRNSTTSMAPLWFHGLSC
eukprot:gene4155-5200_t